MDADADSREEIGNFAAQKPATLPADGKLLRRTEAARLLGVSKSTLRRMEGTALTPVVGPRNVHLFQEEEVRAVVVTRRAHLDTQASSGGIAADAFTLFDAGLHVVDAVKQLRVSPDVIEGLYERWARLRSMLILSAETRSEIATVLMGWDDKSLQTAPDVLAFLKRWMIDESCRSCSECRTEMAAFCRTCAKRWGLATAREQTAAGKARSL
ncbi:MAG: hypothetical protein ABUL60_14885 [Myxococcales bacterium]